VRGLVGGFGWLFGLGVVALVARYGYISSDNQVNGAILAFLFAGVAAGGLFGHAVAVHIWRIHRGWSVLLGLVCVAALVLNISNSLGAIAGRDDKTLAERAKIKETRADDRAELKRLTAEHEALPKFAATTAETVKAAQAAVTAAERIRAAECDKRGPNCRTRETEEQAKRDALTKVLADKAMTERAERLEAQIQRLRTRLDTGDAVRNVNPQGAVFAKLFRLPDSEADTAATWQQFAMSVVVDLLIMACFIAHEVMGWEKRASPATSPATELKASAPALEVNEPAALTRPANVVKLVSSNPPAVSVIEFAANALVRKPGTMLEFDDFYLAYWQHCKAIDGRAVAPTEAVQQTNTLCAECGIRIQRRGKKRYLVGVRLKSASQQPEPMAQMGNASP
jgi:hypothetical protein